MSKRLQVVMDDAEYEEIQGVADAARLTVSAWVRQTLRAARSTGPRTPDVPPAPAAPGVRPDPDLMRTVMDRHGLTTPAEAVDFALRRAAERSMPRTALLGLRGAGWSGDLRALRGGDRAAP